MSMKIPVKNFYLIAVISIGLIGLAVGSTYAMFTATAEINNPISLSSNLAYTSDIVETVEVTVAPGETKEVNLEIWNNDEDDLNYAAWYITDSTDLDFGIVYDESVCGSPTGFRQSGDGVVIKILVRNNGTSTTNIIFGVSSSTGNVVLADNMIILPDEELPVIQHTVTINRQLGTATATTIQTLSVNDGSSSSAVSVAGTTDYPTYESISCTNSQIGSVTTTTASGIDTASVTVSNVTNDTVCTVKFKVPSYTVTINSQLGSATATTFSTLTVNKGSNSSVVSVSGTSSYPDYESISCTNGQTATIDTIDDFTGDYPINTVNFFVENVTSDTVCTVKFKATVTSSTTYTVTIKKSVDNGTATTVETVSVSSGGSYSTTVSGGNYYAVDSVSCTNSQTATVSETFSGVVVNAKFSITNVTNDTVCTIKMTS